MESKSRVVGSGRRLITGAYYQAQFRLTQLTVDFSAFGPALPKLIKEIPRQKRFPKHLMLKVGKRLTATRRMSGHRRRVTVIEVRPKSIIVDGNHPLAGKVVELQVTLIALRTPSADSQDKNCFDVGGEG